MEADLQVGICDVTDVLFQEQTSYLDHEVGDAVGSRRLVGEQVSDYVRDIISGKSICSHYCQTDLLNLGT